MLCTFFVLMVCVIVVEVGGGAQIWSRSEPIRESIKKQMSFVIQEEYSPSDPNSFFNQRIDQLQSTFKCCGIIEPADWAKSKYNGIIGPRNSFSNVVGVISGALGAYRVPPSCCESEDNFVCEAARQIQSIGSATRGLHSTGCLPALWQGLKEYAALAGGIVAAAVGLQIIGLVFTLLLCCAARRELKD
ncbi:CD81 antigen-like [Tropilaelaps mercedesae]|uniref:Tetraspanin n=1 Tax=Tropilaelaps mercedesae TaxID=418985 RepID=A0A1V9XQ83_9ACAR|nr:CD81 antigen-like [Tropilaelaps mercedesae]